MYIQYFSDQEISELLQNAVQVALVGVWSSTPNSTNIDELTPLLHLETKGRPDVFDLIRVLRSEELPSEKLPPFIYSGGNHPGALLRFDITEPVQCSFNILLRWPDDEDVLRLMALNGSLLLFVGDEYKLESSIGVRVNRGELTKIIRIWEQAERE